MRNLGVRRRIACSGCRWDLHCSASFSTCWINFGSKLGHSRVLQACTHDRFLTEGTNRLFGDDMSGGTRLSFARLGASHMLVLAFLLRAHQRKKIQSSPSQRSTSYQVGKQHRLDDALCPLVSVQALQHRPRRIVGPAILQVLYLSS